MESLFSLRKVQRNSQTFIRYYAFKSDLKIKWVRPEKISCILPEKSGDLSSYPPISQKEFLPGYSNSKELENVDELVKSRFRLENNRRVFGTLLCKDMLVKEVQRHHLDYGSIEAKLAKMTASIRRLQESAEQHPRNKILKVLLKEKIDKRKKFLKYLRRWDYKRFEWILEKLDVVYKPPPSRFHWITRKESLQKLVDIHCDEIKQERLCKYRKFLDDQKIDFLEKKLKNLEFIKKEQQECQVQVSVSDNEIQEIRKQLENLKIDKTGRKGEDSITK